MVSSLIARDARVRNHRVKTYTGHLYTRAKVGSAVDLSAVQTGQDSTEVGGECRQNLRTLSTHAHKSDG